MLTTVIIFLSVDLALPVGASGEADEAAIKVSSAFLPSTCQVPQTLDQDKINAIVSPTAERVFGSINKNWTYVEAGQGKRMHTESSKWTPLRTKGFGNVGGKKEVIFTQVPTLLFTPLGSQSLKDEALTDDAFTEAVTFNAEEFIEALEDLIAKPAALECTIALMVVKIFCLKELLGPEQFKRYTSAFYMQMLKSGWKKEEFLCELPRQFLTEAKGEESSPPGSFTYITNLFKYGHFKPSGNMRGSNVVCISQDRYIGFSSIYREGPQPLAAIEAQDFAGFMKQDDVEKDHERHSKTRKMFEENPGRFVTLRRHEQRKINFYLFFDLELIREFLTTGEVILYAA